MPTTHPLADYLKALHDIRSSHSGTEETSYYTALANLLNDVGKSLKPRVLAILPIQNRGAGFPDGGLFTAHQFQKASDSEPIEGQIPERGAIEVKPTKEDAWVVAGGKQVTRYWGKYHQVLVTNYRDFVLVGRDANGNPVKLEPYHLAPTEALFWAATLQPEKAEKEQGERFVEYLKRVMLHAAPLTDPKDVAWFLASYAREAKLRVERGNVPALAALREALEEALGITFRGEKGEHFFRSTLVQTLFYGVFSAWVLWHKENPQREDEFHWGLSPFYLRVPVMQALFEQVSAPTKLKPLDLIEVLDWTGERLNCVVRADFFAKFEEGQAVQYFYEPFLEAFDPDLRKELGVWYTPPEIIQYMVARVDTVLREELEIEDGLADPRVYVLDPCCGTGTYLVEVLRHIAQTLQDKGSDALVANDLKRAALDRVFGFEILPAPFVIAHLQLGLLLQNHGAPLLNAKNERAGVYLTNALTGWEPPTNDVKREIQQLAMAFPALKQEHDAAEQVKRTKPILVILGNPPYNAFAGVSPEEEQGLVEPYKHGLISEWGIKKFNLDELYARFFRLAERRIAEQSGRGVVSFISNNSWVSDPSYVVLRQHILSSFDRFWVENMHGDRSISEYAPDGRTSETIFAIPRFSVGIKQGVVISLWVKSGKKNEPQVLFRDDLTAAKATERRIQLLESLKTQNFDGNYTPANPERWNRLAFRPFTVSLDFLKWPQLNELCADAPSNGLMEKRGESLIDIDRDSLERRMRMYFDPKVDWKSLKELGSGLTEDAARYDAKKARNKVITSETYNETCIRRYALRPFDVRWCYYSRIRPLWNETRPRLWQQAWEGNGFLVSRAIFAKDPEGSPFCFVNGLFDDHILAPDASGFPIRLRQVQALNIQETGIGKPTANLSAAARAYLVSLGIHDPDADEETAGLIWMHALAIGYSPAYLQENTDGIRQGWPRIPLPNSKDRLGASAALGRQIAALLDTDTNLKGVTSGVIRPELKSIGVLSLSERRALDITQDLEITAGWGHAGKDGVTTPGKGKLIERDYTLEERAAFSLTLQLGDTACDIYLNEAAYWRNIPTRVWEYVIGGYQVIKKWLSYRERNLYGRMLTPDEAREVTNMARRIAGILLLESALDANYRAVKELPFAWDKP